MSQTSERPLAEPARRDQNMDPPAAILGVVASAAARFPTAPSTESDIEEALADLGRAAGVDRVAVYERLNTDDGLLSMAQRCAWAPGGLDGRNSDPDHPGVDSPSIPATWGRRLASGEIVHAHTQDLAQDETDLLATQGAVSLAVVPVFAGDRWWGAVTFGQSTGNREWTAQELAALRTAAGILGATVQGRLAEAALRETEDRYRGLVESSPYAIVVHREGVIQFANRGAVQLVGARNTEDLVGRSILELVHSDSRGLILEGLQRLREGRAAPLTEVKFVRWDGTPIDVEVASTPLVLDGRPAVQAVARDITARRRAEEATTESEARKTSILQSALDAIVTIDHGGKILEFNPAAERIFGRHRSEALGQPIAELLIPPHLRARHLEGVARYLATGEARVLGRRVELAAIRADGSEFPVELAITRVEVPGPATFTAYIRDITDRRKVEGQLRDAEAKYRTLVERIPAITYTAEFGETAAWLYVSPQIEAILGFTPDEWMVRPNLWSRQLHPDDRDRVLQDEEVSRRTGHPMLCEYRLFTKDGRVVWVRDESVVVSSEDDAPLLQGVMLDITERKQAEEQLRQTEARYRTLVEQIPAATYLWDVTRGLDHPSLWVSSRLVDILGYDAADWMADPNQWFEHVHPEDREAVIQETTRTVRSGEPFKMEYRMLAADGRVVWVHDEASVVGRDGRGRVTLHQGLLLDTTDRKLVEENLERALQIERQATDRLRALDELKNTFLHAVSHELRTPLAAVLGFALTLEREEVQLPEGERMDIIRRLAFNARKLDQLLSDLLDLDRLDRGILEPRRKPTDVASLVRRVVENSEVLGMRPVQVETPLVVAQLDGPKVERIVENLLVNAARHTPPDCTIWVRVAPEDHGVLISVEDEGAGVPEHLRESIFEPFRRGPDAPAHAPGVGIGLSLVARFAELHGGRAWVSDRPGGGASFKVFLPGGPYFSTGAPTSEPYSVHEPS